RPRRLPISPRIDVAPAAQNEPVELPFGYRPRLGDLDLAPLEASLDQRLHVVVLLSLGRVSVEGKKDAHPADCNELTATESVDVAEIAAAIPAIAHNYYCDRKEFVLCPRRPRPRERES